MMPLQQLKRNPSLGFALTTALVGLIVSFAMVYMGGHNASLLPGAAFHIGAFVGAGAAGWLCFGAFGGKGAKGAFSAAGGSVGMTLLGSVFGTWVCLPIGLWIEWMSSSIRSGGKGDGISATFVDLLEFLAFSPVFGVIAILDATTSPAALLVWCLGMVSLHFCARAIRSRGPIQRISQRSNF